MNKKCDGKVDFMKFFEETRGSLGLGTAVAVCEESALSFYSICSFDKKVWN